MVPEMLYESVSVDVLASATSTDFVAERQFEKCSEMLGAVPHMSGSFCVSKTAAIGMPKFEAGPQKSKGWSVTVPSNSRNYMLMVELTRRAKVIGHWIRPYPGIECFNCGGHVERCEVSALQWRGSRAAAQRSKRTKKRIASRMRPTPEVGACGREVRSALRSIDSQSFHFRLT